MKIRQIQPLLVVAIFAATSFSPTSVECKPLDREAMDPLQTIADFAGYKRQYTISPQGIYTFYYVLPQSSRFEERTASGEVRGNYAYVAPEGDKFKFKYEAGKKGFQVESNALPSAPEDTEEVKKAKEVFFEAYQRALALAELEEEFKGENKGHTDVQRIKNILRLRGEKDEEVVRGGVRGNIGNVRDESDSEDEDDDDESEEGEDDESSEESSEEDDDDESSEEDDESSEEDDDDESSEEDDDESSEEDDDDDESSEEDDDDDESDEDVRKSLNIRGRLKHNNQVYSAPRRRRLIRTQQPTIQRILSHIDKSIDQNNDSNINRNTPTTQRRNTGTTSRLNQPQTIQNQLQNPSLKIAGNSYFIRNSNRNQTSNPRRTPTRSRTINTTSELNPDSSPSIQKLIPNNRHFTRIPNTTNRQLNRHRTAPTNRQLNRVHKRKVPRNQTESARIRDSRQPIIRPGRKTAKRFVLLP